MFVMFPCVSLVTRTLLPSVLVVTLDRILLDDLLDELRDEPPEDDLLDDLL